MVNIDKIREIVGVEEAEEIRAFLTECEEHRRQRVSDNIAIYDRIMQGIEGLGEQCEAWELLEDGEEKLRGLRSYSENLRTISSLVQARGGLLRLMMIDE